MKKLRVLLIFTLLLTCMSVGTTASATTPKVIGHIYSTDIVAYIDDMPIKSYNIGGQTVVSEWELERYGFKDTWDGTNRVLTIESQTKPTKAPTTDISKGKSGKKLGKVYETDIRTIVNDYEVKSYNIGGQTMIPLEQLSQNLQETNAPNENREIGYSNNGFKTVWNSKNRTIKVYSIRPGSSLTTKYGTYKIVDTCNSYSIGGFNDDLNEVTSLIQDKGNADIINVDLSTLFPYFSINPTWTNNCLTIKNPIIKKNFSSKYRSQSIARSDALLPIIEVPVNINDNGKMEYDNFRVAVGMGEFFSNIDDWKKYLFVNP